MDTIRDTDTVCGAYRYSTAGRAVPSGPWGQDRCVAPTNETGLCEAHAKAARVPYREYHRQTDDED